MGLEPRTTLVSVECNTARPRLLKIRYLCIIPKLPHIWIDVFLCYFFVFPFLFFLFLCFDWPVSLLFSSSCIGNSDSHLYFALCNEINNCNELSVYIILKFQKTIATASLAHLITSSSAYCFTSIKDYITNLQYYSPIFLN